MQSTYAVVTCHSCMNRFNVYWNHFPDSSVKCPHCQASMDEHMTQQLKKALATIHDLNYHFEKYNTERKEPLFSVTVENCPIPSDNN